MSRFCLAVSFISARHRLLVKLQTTNTYLVLSLGVNYINSGGSCDGDMLQYWLSEWKQSKEGMVLTIHFSGKLTELSGVVLGGNVPWDTVIIYYWNRESPLTSQYGGWAFYGVFLDGACNGYCAVGVRAHTSRKTVCGVKLINTSATFKDRSIEQKWP